MADGPGYEMPLQRRLTGETDYQHRLQMLKSGVHRAVIRVSNNHVRVQLVQYTEQGDETVAAGFSGELSGFGWAGHTGNLPAAYLAGVLAGVRAAASGVDTVVPDFGAETPEYGSRYYAAVNGLRDAGLDVPADTAVFPGEDRINGTHLEAGGAEAVDEVKKNIMEQDGEA
ncbi:MAG: 50S ribosomal protein L18 [Candidatus Nanohaloarchaea archaeon]|nr:50S ribosomal protein L18 [Candidatus Nanohaloarchaea archaeon]